MKLRTKNYIQKALVSKLFNEQLYNKIKLNKIIMDYLLGMDYENCRTLFKNTIKPDSVVLDIGANMGQYACRLNKIIKNGAIYSFEPYQKNYFSLLKMKKLLNMDNVNPIHSAISEKKGTLKLMIPVIDKNLIVGTQAVLEEFKRTDYENVKYYEEIVSVNTIDSFVAENNINRIDFIKIDTEGAEIGILKGGIESIRKYTPVLSVEISPASVELNFIYELGYKPYIIHNKSLIQYDPLNKSIKAKGNLILINTKTTSI